MAIGGIASKVSALNAKPDGSPMEMLESVRRAVDSFVLSAKQFDDLTMLCLEYKGPQQKMKE